MTRSEYFKKAFDLYNAGEVDGDTYDAMCMNADQFCDDDEEESEWGGRNAIEQRSKYSLCNTP